MDTLSRIFELADKKFPEQQAFAAAIGVSAKTVSVWRTGRGKSYTKYLTQIAAALDTNVEYLLTGKTESSPPQKRDRLPDVWYELTDAQKAQAEEFMRFLRAARTEGD